MESSPMAPPPAVFEPYIERMRAAEAVTPAAPELYLQLMAASQQANVRGLVQTAKWAADLAMGLGLQQPPDATGCLAAPLADLPPGEQSMYLLAKTYFDAREFRRCARLLTSCEAPLLVFLRYYSLYLAGERAKDEETEGDMIVRAAGPRVINAELDQIRADLQTRQRQGGLDAYGFYLLGIVLREQGHNLEAQDVLAKAVELQPTFWGAWRELGATCRDFRDVDRMLTLVPTHWMLTHLLAWLAVELHTNEGAVGFCSTITDSFPQSREALAQIAVAYYNMQDVDSAADAFDQLLRLDPLRLDHLDVYSNILFLQGQNRKLTYLAHSMADIDKYRPETCCAIANYYSLQGQHEKSVIYFQRALKLNRRYLAAWTLVGHEYLELRNTPGAIAAYRKAIEIDPRDHRPWFGLGQTYELKKLYSYAAHYYRQAQRLRPRDPRMWQALADNYKNMNLLMAAAQAYEMVVALGGETPDLHMNLGLLYKSVRENFKAGRAFARFLVLTEKAPIEHRTLQACALMCESFKGTDEEGPAREMAMRLLRRSERDAPNMKTSLMRLVGDLLTEAGAASEAQAQPAAQQDGGDDDDEDQMDLV